MEMTRKIGLAEKLREQGKKSHDHFCEMGLKYSSTVVGVPGLRISQATFEAWIKKLCDQDPLTDLRFGWKMESATETKTGVQVEAVEVDSGKKRTILAKYAVGCDGASSRMRKSLDIPVIGVSMYEFSISSVDGRSRANRLSGQFITSSFISGQMT